MTENVENLILEHLNAIRAENAKIGEKVDNLTQRVSSMERHLANLHDDMANIQRRLDKHDDSISNSQWQ